MTEKNQIKIQNNVQSIVYSTNHYGCKTSNDTEM